MRLRGRIAYLSEVEMAEFGDLSAAIHNTRKRITVQIESLTNEPARTYPANLILVGIHSVAGISHGTATFALSLLKEMDAGKKVMNVEAMLFTARVVVEDNAISLYNHKLYKE